MPVAPTGPRQWGYEVAHERLGDATVTEAEAFDRHQGIAPSDKIVIKDQIAEMLFQQMLLRADGFEVPVTPNFNGDHIADALTAQVGAGMTLGANIGYDSAVFEATHGTAPNMPDWNRSITVL